MGTRLKKFSHSILVKTIVFLLMIACVAGAMDAVYNIFKTTNGNIEIIFENNYMDSSSFTLKNEHTLQQLAELITIYKGEKHVLEGNTINKEELADRTEQAYWDREDEAESKEDIADGIKQEMIANDFENFQMILNNLDKEKEPLYFVTDGKHTFTNTKQTEKAQFKKYPVYYISEGYDWEVQPSELEQTYPFYGYSHVERPTNPENTKMFVGYTEDYIETATSEWTEKKASVMNHFYYLLAYVALFFLSLLYLMITTGRKSFKDQTVYLHPIDKLYVDVQLLLLLVVMGTWFITGIEWSMVNWGIYFVTLIIVAICVIFLLSMIRHMKNKTFFTHSIIYIVLHWLYQFVKDIYDSGSVGVKIVLVVILYPIIAAATLFFFPITIGVAVWLALKKVKSFNKIQDGAKKMREGNLQHHIDIDGEGEFATLASNINGINEGFKQAVHNELKNERMKTELITNVSHDIRTPLTSLITYTDLLKTETDPEKMQEYIEILDQKSKRLKVLTDDLFAAAKASSGDIPVDLQQIDVVALINQGIGEVSDQISTKNLTFKCNYPEEKMYVTADGKLLWRSIENILSNIFNYALEDSRVYIDITHQGDGILISFKNISKYELNITEEELMERFTRGEESRTGHGSGLGLSITKSLIENQNGKFEINIDGDLFKSMIYLPSIKKDDVIEMK